MQSENNSNGNQKRGPMVDACYYCLCNTCMNNAESMTLTPDELPYDWKPCFFCDECSRFGNDCHKDMKRKQCERYVIDNFHAEKNRKNFKIVR